MPFRTLHPETKASGSRDCPCRINIHIVIRVKNMYIDMFLAALVPKRPGL